MSATHSARKHRDRIAYVVCSTLAIALVTGVWIWTARMTVVQGLDGARDVLSGVSEAAGTVRSQSQPDPEVISAVKDGFQDIIREQQASDLERQQAVDALAKLMGPSLDVPPVETSDSQESVVKE